MEVEIWLDVVCPWCYIGKRRLEAALVRFDHRDGAEIVWRSFELDPEVPRQRDGDPADRLAAKYGITREQALASRAHITELAAHEGLEFRLDQSKPGNTFDAHRLLHLASDRGVQNEVKERLLAAYVSEGEPIGDPDTLVRLASQVGLDAGEVRSVFDSDKYAQEVRADEHQASRLAITGVPFFVVDRTYAVSGAQPAELLLEVLDRAWTDTHPLVVVEGTAGLDLGCDADSCAI
jgi:predicted DsbA family dithiol-disulfide isomerase